MVERVGVRVIIEAAVPLEAAKREQCARAEEVGPTGGDVVGLDLRPLVLECRLGVKRVGRVEPGARVGGVQVDSVSASELKIYAIEKVLLVALGVDHLKLRRIQEPSCIQAADGNEIAPLLVPDCEVEAGAGRTEGAVGGGYAAGGCGLSQAGTGNDLDHQAGLISEFGRRRAANHFDRLHGIDGKLVA